MNPEEAKSRDRLEAEVVAALEASGCPVCRVVRDAEERYWSYLLYAGFQDAETQLRARAAAGYCRRHRDQLLERNRTIFPGAVLAQASARGGIDRLTHLSGLRGRRRRSPRSMCPVCSDLIPIDRLALDALGRLLERDARFAVRYEEAEGLCFPHAEAAAERQTAAEVTLAAHAGRVLGSQDEELGRLIKSFDYRLEPADRELAGAWKRTFAFLLGNPGPLG